MFAACWKIVCLYDGAYAATVVPKRCRFFVMNSLNPHLWTHLNSRCTTYRALAREICFTGRSAVAAGGLVAGVAAPLTRGFNLLEVDVGLFVAAALRFPAKAVPSLDPVVGLSL